MTTLNQTFKLIAALNYIGKKEKGKKKERKSDKHRMQPYRVFSVEEPARK